MFLTVAKTESITLSARSLHLSQSMLSKNIALIERELGLILFAREKGRLKLTPAGKTMMEELTVACEIIEDAVEKAHAQQAEQARSLRVGISDAVNPEKYLFPTLENYKGKNAQLVFSFESFPFPELPVKLHRGELDVIFTPLFEEPTLNALGLEYECIASFPYTACVTLDNELSCKDSVDINDLKMLNLIVYSPRFVPNFYEIVIKPLFEPSGHKPNVSYYASSSGAILMNTLGVNDVFVADRCRKIDTFFNLKQIPIISDHESGVLMSWRKKSHPFTVAFVKDSLVFWNGRKIL